MPDVHLEEISFPLHQLSSVFPKSLTDLSGQVAATGQIHFSGTSNIAGPFFLMLKDVNFRIGDTPVNNVNSVIAVQSLLPLVSAPNQTMFIEKIDTLVPLTDIHVSFQLENQALRLLSLDSTLGNERLSLSSALIPYRKPNALLYLKTNQDFDISHFAPFLDFSTMTPVGGKASLAIPVDISENGVQPTSVTLKVSNMTLRQIPGKPDPAGLFAQDNDAYMIRNGQLILDKDEKLQLDLDGWLMPMRKREAFSKTDILLERPLFKSGPSSAVPNKIKERQKSFIQMLTEQLK